ncbi:ABC transporter permease [Aureibaculum sp. 2210JD6-5]|uniref:ABC transporter permease n=1 Tax=Aureibaculum sp. 2210JD6-5 TaxID=3103957 RepID=UPI002AAD6473|nr:ABC transporter permease [Aureibaculum sp. 2210JD6-5]MDY7393892.1 ABC transporter permease [Aureibaculum sp. 2210JD6-5]
MKNNTRHIDIKNFLPHRPPMLMVDNVLFIDDQSVKTNFLIKSDCIFVGEDGLSESGLIENAAQTCSAIVGKSFFDEEDVEGKNNQVVGFISGVKSFNIIKLPLLKETIITTANLISRFDAEGYSICAIKCNIESENSVLAECEMNLFIQEVKVSNEKK